MPAPAQPLDRAKPRPTRERILDAAARLFVGGSYSDVTVDQIAEAAEVTKGAVYHHFETKQALYVGMIHCEMARQRSALEAAMRNGGDARSRLSALIRCFLSMPPSQRAPMQLIRRDANIFVDPVRQDLVRAYQEALPALVEEIIRDGIRGSELVPVDARLLAWEFIALVEVLLTPYADQRFADDEDKLMHAMSLFLDGCARARGPAAPSHSVRPRKEAHR